MNNIQLINDFWNSFGLKAYDETSVPDKLEYPYITYNLSIGDFYTETAMTASLWYYDTSWTAASEKLQAISDKIGLGGVVLHDSNHNSVWIKKGAPFAQRMSDQNDMIRRFVINISAEFIEN